MKRETRKLIGNTLSIASIGCQLVNLGVHGGLSPLLIAGYALLLAGLLLYWWPSG